MEKDEHLWRAFGVYYYSGWKPILIILNDPNLMR